jgi:omega-6 fatty acid desaturase (delta-12 desaturase)
MNNPALSLQKNIHARLKKYAYSDNRKAIWQLANTSACFAFGIWLLSTLYSLELYWACPFGILLCSLTLLRFFVLQHDCGHHTFFTNKTANNIVGFFLGILTFTPILNWRYSHNVHHATNGHLDKRGLGDVWIMTLEEYAKAPVLLKIKYRLYRNPLILFLFGSLFYFVVRRRFGIALTPQMKREQIDIALTNTFIVLLHYSLYSYVGLKATLLITLPVFALTAAFGVWLFYIQHVFEDAYWERAANWSFYNAALEGSTFYDLPDWLHWFSANIGYHHIHHLESRIPNYNLKACMVENRELFNVHVVRLSDTFTLMRLKLWDEQKKKYVPFS